MIELLGEIGTHWLVLGFGIVLGFWLRSSMAGEL